MGIEYIMVIIFIIGYVMIATEHSIHINKAASALLIGMLCWGIYALWPAEHLKVDDSRTILELSRDADLAESNPALSSYFFKLQQDHMEEVYRDPVGMADKLTIPAEETPQEVQHYVEHGLSHHLFDIAGILLFLLGAMTIVELMDAHSAFEVITSRISSVNKIKLLWIVSIVTFFLSAALDNLTTAIVMISVIRKLIDDKETKWIFGGFIIIAANAGGAWSPIGDVTTTMLWNNGQLPDSMALITHIFLPAIVSLAVPLIFASIFMRGNVQRPAKIEAGTHGHSSSVSNSERNVIFTLGLAGLLFVPVWKTLTHLPPYTGMMFSLGIIWVVSELMHKAKAEEDKKGLSVIAVLQKIDTSSVLFFLGILMAVAALQEVGHLAAAAHLLDTALDGNLYTINVSIGLLSAIVDNVPLVAAAQGMYPLQAGTHFAVNGEFWQFLAFCAGTGGSILIIGSAAGVAVMGLEKIPFGWYLKKVSLYALVGYFAGAAVFYFMA